MDVRVVGGVGSRPALPPGPGSAARTITKLQKQVIILGTYHAWATGSAL